MSIRRSKNESGIRIALAGNPNSGKTTIFNGLTGSSQMVGNWPGVTLEKKEGRLKDFSDVILVDLPGIYSLSPYSPEEVVSRDFLIKEDPDAIINIVDASNLERNLYLTTQILDTGIPTVVALNMMDIVQKRGDTIDVKQLEKELGCRVIETSALKGIGTKEVAAAAAEASKESYHEPAKILSKRTESVISEISSIMKGSVGDDDLRWYAIKMFERDEMVLAEKEELWNSVEQIVSKAEKEADDDSESIIADERYNFIVNIVKKVLKKKEKTELDTTEKIDRIVTNKWLALPIFVGVIFAVYFISVSTIGAILTDWVNETVFGEWITPGVTEFLENAGVEEWMTSLISGGIIAGVGAVLGFLPQMFILFVLLVILEDCGYMSRIAFLMDKVFRRFGLSGKSLIPILIGTGCGVPGILASRTIESDEERKVTAMTTTFMPCSAKLPIIALIAGAVFTSSWWIAPIAYFIGILAVLTSGLILKKFRKFVGHSSPFIMELPLYHAPHIKVVGKQAGERTWAFIKRAGTIILLASIFIWFFVSFDSNLTFLGDAIEDSMLASAGNFLAPIFGPLGWGDWQSTVATLTGLISKENVVATFGILFGTEMDTAGIGWGILADHYTQLAAFSFLTFNLLCAPCIAAMATLFKELGGWRTAGFAIAYQCGFAYAVSMMIYQFGSLIAGEANVLGMIASFAVLALLIFLMIRKDPETKEGVGQ